MCLNWSKKIQKIIEATSSWSLDLLDLSCVDRSTTSLPSNYLTCCYFAVWDESENSLKNKHGFSFLAIFFVILQASVPVIALSKFVNSCYQMLCVPVSSHWWYWLKRVQVKLVAFNHRNFDWKFVCSLLLYWSHLLSSFSVSVVFSANWK